MRASKRASWDGDPAQYVGDELDQDVEVLGELGDLLEGHGFKWQDPPPDVRRGRPPGVCALAPDPMTLLARLDEHPGRWARMRRYSDRRAAHRGLKRAFALSPDGYEYLRRDRDLYARRVVR